MVKAITKIMNSEKKEGNFKDLFEKNEEFDGKQ